MSSEIEIRKPYNQQESEQTNFSSDLQMDECPYNWLHFRVSTESSVKRTVCGLREPATNLVGMCSSQK